MWDSSQQASAILYLCSTCAQVWAALLIFYVLLLRDLGKSGEEKKLEIWNFVNEHVATFRKTLLAGLDENPDRYKEYQFDRHDVLHSPTDWECFGRFLERLAVSPLILREGKNLGITSPKIFWEPLLSANFKVKALTRVRKTGFQSLVFQIGMVLIGFNVVLLGMQPLICSAPDLAKWVLLIVAFLNIVFGFLMYSEIKKAV